ncbi:OPT oligopeptide transporter protein-domain-containing protein [Phlyctochytrium arcticum]|nr:OPT oligopeptide transporter protein-domain-containing protein [Phlyctochytrium arcticum]
MSHDHADPTVHHGVHAKGDIDGFEHSGRFDQLVMPVGLPDEGTALTFRALLIGTILGSIVGASNIYLGLKTGFTFGASLFGAIFGFAVMKSGTRLLPALFGRRYFGPKENCTVQTAATAAGGLSSLFVAAVPAMYHLKLMGDSLNPKDQFGRLLALTFITAYYGLFFAIPLRKYFIIKQKLVFPTPTASANTILSLHQTGGEAEGIFKAKIMAYSMLGSILWTVFAFFVPGVKTWYVFWWIYKATGWEAAREIDAWTWFLDWTPAFIGAGMLTGLHASVSMWFGSFLAWGVVGPALYHNGKVVAPFMTLSKLDDPANFPTARYWMLWPGILTMICASFTELFLNWRMIYTGMKGGVLLIVGRFKGRRQSSAVAGGAIEEDDDPAPPHEQVPAVLWVSGFVLSVITTILVMSFVFDVGVDESILAIILACIFSFVGLQASGTTDVNPVGAIAKSSQFVFGGVSRSKGWTEGDLLKKAQLTNLLAGSISGSAASQAVDMVGDLKTGHLLHASPKTQFYAQMAGTFGAVFISIALYVLYAGAYPCINDVDAETCPFALPSVAAWAKTAEALTSPNPAIPTSSGIAAIVLGCIAIIAVITKHRLPKKYKWMIPNFSAIGIAWVLQTTQYSNAMVIGALLMTVWERKNPASWAVWGYALSSGLIAGEGLGGLINAIFAIGGLEGEKVGTAFGCHAGSLQTPWEVSYCG